MAFFVFQGIDRPGAAELRERIRPAHRAHLRHPFSGCRCVLGGPMTDDAGAQMVGSLLVLEADDRAAAQRFLARDPYAVEGLFIDTRLSRWSWTLGGPAEETSKREGEQ